MVGFVSIKNQVKNTLPTIRRTNSRSDLVISGMCPLKEGLFKRINAL